MRLTASIGRQAGDFLAYILLPVVCLVLPFRRGQALIGGIADRGWLLQARSQAALAAAQRYLPVAEPGDWARRWRRTELLEARDLWFALLGRGRAASRAVRVRGLPPPGPGLVLVGMHWGPSVLGLELFRAAGLAPRFVYRPAGRDVLRSAPFHYLYLRLLMIYIRRSCGGRDIPVPGARQRLQAALHERGTPVLLLDAPVARAGNSMYATVADWSAEFSREGAEVLTLEGAACVFYALGMDGDGLATLRCTPEFRPGSADELITAYARFLEEHLQRDSAQWRLWPVAGQLLRERIDGPGTQFVPTSEMSDSASGRPEPDGTAFRAGS